MQFFLKSVRKDVFLYNIKSAVYLAWVKLKIVLALCVTTLSTRKKFKRSKQPFIFSTRHRGQDPMVCHNLLQALLLLLIVQSLQMIYFCLYVRGKSRLSWNVTLTQLQFWYPSLKREGEAFLTKTTESECHPVFASRGKKVETTSSDSGKTAKYPVDTESKMPSESETKKLMARCIQRHTQSFSRIRCVGPCSVRKSRHLFWVWVHHALSK